MFKNKRIYVVPILGFLILISVLAFLLILPISNYGTISILDAIFISASSVSGTGFSTLVIAENFTVIGQLFLLLGIQIGALGFMIFFSLVLSIRKKRISLTDTVILSNEISFDSYAKVKERTFRIIKYVFVIEFLGVILLSFRFIPEYGISKGIWLGIFHSVSSFCNAGFDLFGSNSLIKYSTDLYINIVVIFLMFLGGLGYFVLEDLMKIIFTKNKQIRFHSKMILTTSFCLVLLSVILIKLLSPNLTIMQILFTSITARSTGFSTINLSTVNNATKIVVTFLMLIGGAPGSNAGGIRLNTFSIIVLLPLAFIKNEDLVVFYRKVDSPVVRRAITMVIIYILTLLIGLITLAYFNDINTLDLAFELVSAFSNTGLGTFDINKLNVVSKIILIIYMYIGRLGPVTFLTLFTRPSKKDSSIKYATADLML